MFSNISRPNIHKASYNPSRKTDQILENKTLGFRADATVPEEDVSLQLSDSLNTMKSSDLLNSENDLNHQRMINSIENELRDDYPRKRDCNFVKKNFSKSMSSLTKFNSPRTSNVLPAVSKKIYRPDGSIEVVNLRPISEIPERYHSVFPFKHFNCLQSKVFEDIMYSDKQTVICAPTGSGKTVLFELCIIRLLLTSGNNLFNFKMIYMAPIKALCSERYQDWCNKFSGYGLKCQELTGDTEIDDFQELSMSHIIFTTPEKWDSMTRRWKDHKSLVQSIRLFMIDEVHLVNDDTRGATLEAVVSRMKTVQVSINESVKTGSPMRFVAVSATIPNVNDIATWLDTGISPAIGIKCGEEYRPVALRKVVLGYPFNDSQSDFKFDMMLNYKLGNIIHTYSENKPTIVFCNTRKGVSQGASILIKDAHFSMTHSHKQNLARYANMIHDSKLQECVYQGVGFHHAGLEITDRKNIEDMFAAGNLPVLFCTSTLAMGVNLPAHLVVIKGTMYYMMGGFTEYSEAQVLQMMGRAGRPQFDTSATSVIMTKEKTKVKYQGLVLGNQNIESSLHLHLTEHVMAEVVLGTIDNVNIAKEWLKSTFLYRRMLENPKHYGAPEKLDKAALGKKLQAMCLRTLKSLELFELINFKDEVGIVPTETGKLMARFCIVFETVKIISSATGKESLEELIGLLSKSKELEDLKIRTNEKKILNALNQDKNHPTIRFPIDSKIKTTEMKVNCLLQAGLGCLTITDFSLSQDSIKIFQFAQRIARFMMEYFMQQGKFQTVLNSIILLKCIKVKLWENSKYISKQLEKIGPTLSTALVNAGITSFAKLEATNPRELEMIMNRHPPFGSQIQEVVAALPKYDVIIEQEGSYQERSASLLLTVRLLNYTNRSEYLVSKKMQSQGCVVVIGDQDNTVVFKHKLLDYQLTNTGMWSRKVSVNASENSANHELNCYLINLDYVGLDIQCSFTPVYLGYFPKQVKVETSHLERGRNSKSSMSVTQCNHKCIDKFSCGHQCCKAHLPSTSCVPSKKKVKKNDGSNYKESRMISQLHQELNRRKTILPNVVPLKKIKLELPMHQSNQHHTSLHNIDSHYSFSYNHHQSNICDYENSSSNVDSSKNVPQGFDQFAYKQKSSNVKNRLANISGKREFKLLGNEIFDSSNIDCENSNLKIENLKSYNHNQNEMNSNFIDSNQYYSDKREQSFTNNVQNDLYEFNDEYLKNDCDEPLPTLSFQSGKTNHTPTFTNDYIHNNNFYVENNNGRSKILNEQRSLTTTRKSLFNQSYVNNEDSLIISSDEENDDWNATVPSMNQSIDKKNSLSKRQRLQFSTSNNSPEDLLFDDNCIDRNMSEYKTGPYSSDRFFQNGLMKEKIKNNGSGSRSLPYEKLGHNNICQKENYNNQAFFHDNSSVVNENVLGYESTSDDFYKFIKKGPVEKKKHRYNLTRTPIYQNQIHNTDLSQNSLSNTSGFDSLYKSLQDDHIDELKNYENETETLLLETPSQSLRYDQKDNARSLFNDNNPRCRKLELDETGNQELIVSAFKSEDKDPSNLLISKISPSLDCETNFHSTKCNTIEKTLNYVSADKITNWNRKEKLEMISDWQKAVFYDEDLEISTNDCDEYGFSDIKDADFFL